MQSLIFVTANQSSSVDTDTVRNQELSPKTMREAARATGFTSSEGQQNVQVRAKVDVVLKAQVTDEQC